MLFFHRKYIPVIIISMSYKVQNLQAGTLSELNVFNSRQVIIGGNNTTANSDDVQIVGASNLTVTLNPSTGKLFLKDNPVLIKENAVKLATGIITALDLSKGVVELQVAGVYTLDTTVNIRNQLYDMSGSIFVGSPRPLFEVTFYNTSGGSVTVNSGTGQTFTNGVSVILSTGSSRTVKMIFVSNTTMIVEDAPSSPTVTLTSASVPGLGEASLPVDGTGPTLSVKKLVAGSNVTLSNNATDVTISATGSSSDVTTWGSWTPTIISGISSLTVNQAQYQRVGNKVNLLFDISVTVNASGSSVTVGGLPLPVFGFGLTNDIANSLWIDNTTDILSLLGRSIINETTPNNVRFETNSFINTKSYSIIGQLFYTVFVPSASYLWSNWTPTAGVGVGSLTVNKAQYQLVSTGVSIIVDLSFTANATGSTVTLTSLPFPVNFVGGLISVMTIVENVTDVTSFVAKVTVTGTTVSVTGASTFTNTKSYNLQFQFTYPI